VVEDISTKRVLVMEHQKKYLFDVRSKIKVGAGRYCVLLACIERPRRVVVQLRQERSIVKSRSRCHKFWLERNLELYNIASA
jgi:hypothetical protein